MCVGGRGEAWTFLNTFLSKAIHTESHDIFYGGDVRKFYIFQGKVLIFKQKIWRCL